MLTESRDTFGSPIWIDRLDLNCYSQEARGTPRGTLTCRSYNVLRDVHCCRVEGECGVAPGGDHNHRDPVAAEVRYLRVRYLARVFCCEGRMAVGLTAYLGGLVGMYQLPWTPQEVMRSMMDRRKDEGGCRLSFVFYAVMERSGKRQVFRRFSPRSPT
jgi:hypothetical protein